ITVARRGFVLGDAEARVELHGGRVGRVAGPGPVITAHEPGIENRLVRGVLPVVHPITITVRRASRQQGEIRTPDRTPAQPGPGAQTHPGAALPRGISAYRPQRSGTVPQAHLAPTASRG